jgi:hypothetical protein
MDPPEWRAAVRYNLGGKATAFQTWAAVHDRSALPPEYEYTVLGDGKVLWNSKTVTPRKPTLVLLNVREVQELELRVGGRPFYAVWVDPCVWVKD